MLKRLKYGIAVLVAGLVMMPATIFAENASNDYLDTSALNEAVVSFSEDMKENELNDNTHADGWETNSDGTKSYWKNGTKVQAAVINIAGSYYGFNDEGVMYDNCEFHLSGKDGYIYYRAKNGGKLYCNEWFKDLTFGESYIRWYYYLDNGANAEDLVTINGVKYFFSITGRMYTNTTVKYNDKRYIINNDGRVFETKEGWNHIGGEWYYVVGNELSIGLKEIDGYLYYFSSRGQMYDNTTLTVYNDGKKYTYFIKLDGRLYRNEWYNAAGYSSDSWYYYGDDGQRVIGFNEIDGKLYYFNSSGVLTVNKSMIIDGKLYFIDEDGVVTQTKEGWNKYKNEWYYVKDGTPINDGFADIDGKKYYFESGKMMTNMHYVDWSTDTLYDTGASGEAVAINGEQWVLTREGYWYYIGEDNKVTLGWKTIDGDTYYFRNSKISTGGRCYISLIFHIGSKSYYFDSDGKLVKDGWINFGAEYLYANESGELAKGDVKIDGVWYRFNDRARMMTGLVDAGDGKYYYYNSDGSYLGEIKNTEGWNKINNSWYYISEGVIYTDCVVTLSDGKLYVFDEKGRMLSEQFYKFYNSTDKKYYNVYLTSKGNAVKGWFKKMGLWYYADPETGYLLSGFKEIDSVKYYFNDDGRMMTGSVKYGNIIYHFDENGACQSEKRISDGWSYYDGKYYYYKDGQSYTGWVDDCYYISSGNMSVNTSIKYDGKYYLLDKFGKLVSKKSCWYELNGQWYYFKANGQIAVNSWIESNGKWYYASKVGYIYRNEIVYINGTWNVFDEDGVWVQEVTSPKKGNGWAKKNNKWYYFISGELVKGAANIGGVNYYFSSNTGEMLTNAVAGNYFYGEDGVRAEYKGWKKIAGYWCYFDSNYKMHSGWLKVDGKTYYLTSKVVDGGYGLIYTPATNVKRLYQSDSDLKWYVFDNDGVLSKIDAKVEGWQYLDYLDEWVYARNGKCVTGLVEIDKKFYLFNPVGYLYTSKVVLHNGAYHFCDKNGVVVTKTGWYKDSENRDVFVNSNGEVVKGIVRWNGKDYISAK